MIVSRNFGYTANSGNALGRK